MTLRLNTHRTFAKSVNIEYLDDNGKTQKGAFGATFKILPNTELMDDSNSGKRVLDMVLVSIKEDELELIGADGQPLKGAELLEAAKADPTIANALMDTYNEGVAKKARNRI
ncbi:hypothetical protein [Marinomonas fungiae]|uniref:Uncharacterized protein n=1 Tax=Marinomonas fungiae TaxID=1137284 RepID=A0A0K6IIM4_9GAMM|nr:hypothetical protein [Marinomonas fungiae]CUB03162.1 hypothetical protein Ga0061065_10310 [Marinomonas fungiae]